MIIPHETVPSNDQVKVMRPTANPVLAHKWPPDLDQIPPVSYINIISNKQHFLYRLNSHTVV